jgi:hypothetical protein
MELHQARRIVENLQRCTVNLQIQDQKGLPQDQLLGLEIIEIHLLLIA